MSINLRFVPSLPLLTRESLLYYYQIPVTQALLGLLSTFKYLSFWFGTFYPTIRTFPNVLCVEWYNLRYLSFTGSPSLPLYVVLLLFLFSCLVFEPFVTVSGLGLVSSSWCKSKIYQLQCFYGDFKVI